MFSACIRCIACIVINHNGRVTKIRPQNSTRVSAHYLSLFNIMCVHTYNNNNNDSNIHNYYHQ